MSNDRKLKTDGNLEIESDQVNINSDIDVTGDLGGTTLTTTGNANIGGDATITGGLTADGITYPSADGTAGQVIETDGNGNLSFVDQGLGSAYPAVAMAAMWKPSYTTPTDTSREYWDETNRTNTNAASYTGWTHHLRVNSNVFDVEDVSGPSTHLKRKINVYATGVYEFEIGGFWQTNATDNEFNCNLLRGFTNNWTYGHKQVFDGDSGDYRFAKFRWITELTSSDMFSISAEDQATYGYPTNVYTYIAASFSYSTGTYLRGYDTYFIAKKWS